ncbi:hypothetical protein DFH06DRAFT_1151222 [Mycena polygramma]|nr:hypothetical protein DFH06DRAFT_1151222 [Mycena polygramma]
MARNGHRPNEDARAWSPTSSFRSRVFKRLLAQSGRRDEDLRGREGGGKRQEMRVGSVRRRIRHIRHTRRNFDLKKFKTQDRRDIRGAAIPGDTPEATRYLALPGDTCRDLVFTGNIQAPYLSNQGDVDLCHIQVEIRMVGVSRTSSIWFILAWNAEVIFILAALRVHGKARLRTLRVLVRALVSLQRVCSLNIVLRLKIQRVSVKFNHKFDLSNAFLAAQALTKSLLLKRVHSMPINAANAMPTQHQRQLNLNIDSTSSRVDLFVVPNFKAALVVIRASRSSLDKFD